MKLRFNRQEMGDALAAICSVAAARTPKEILKCVRLEAKADVLLLSATDLELSLRCAVTQVEVDEPGDSVVNADTLARIVRESRDELLGAETDATQLHIRGSGSHFQIVTQDVGDFPPVPAMEGEADFTIERDVLQRLVEWTSLAAARESTRYAINGVLWEIDGDKLTLAATDGRRLSVAHDKFTAGKGSPAVTEAILPVKALSVLSRLSVEGATAVAVKLTANQAFITLGGAVIGTSLVEGHFPNYRDVVPADCDRTAMLKTAEFLSALKQASLLTNEESKGVRLAFSEGDLTISSRAPEQGEATVSIPVEFKHEPLEVGFNPVFLLDVLRAVHTDEITLSLKEANRPGVLRAQDGFLYVVMPVNLTSA